MTLLDTQSSEMLRGTLGNIQRLGFMAGEISVPEKLILKCHSSPWGHKKRGTEAFVLRYQYADPPGLENNEYFLKSRRDDISVETSITRTPYFRLPHYLFEIITAIIEITS